MICKAFRDVGITLLIDGSQDDQLQIKGIPAADFVIGDGSVVDGSGNGGSGMGVVVVGVAEEVVVQRP